MPTSAELRSIAEMLVDIEQYVGMTHPAADGKVRQVHVYPAADGWFNAFLTPDEARIVETLWFGEDVATENYEVLTYAD